MIFLYILGAIVAIVVILAIAAPKNYNVSRSITINKARSEVFPYIRVTIQSGQLIYYWDTGICVV